MSRGVGTDKRPCLTFWAFLQVSQLTKSYNREDITVWGNRSATIVKKLHRAVSQLDFLRITTSASCVLLQLPQCNFKLLGHFYWKWFCRPISRVSSLSEENISNCTQEDFLSFHLCWLSHQTLPAQERTRGKYHWAVKSQWPQTFVCQLSNWYFWYAQKPSDGSSIVVLETAFCFVLSSSLKICHDGKKQ